MEHPRDSHGRFVKTGAIGAPKISRKPKEKVVKTGGNASPTTGICMYGGHHHTIEMSNPQEVTMSNGKHRMTGVCPTHGTKMSKIL